MKRAIALALLCASTGAFASGGVTQADIEKIRAEGQLRALVGDEPAFVITDSLRALCRKGGGTPQVAVLGARKFSARCEGGDLDGMAVVGLRSKGSMVVAIAPGTSDVQQWVAKMNPTWKEKDGVFEKTFAGGVKAAAIVGEVPSPVVVLLETSDE